MKAEKELAPLKSAVLTTEKVEEEPPQVSKYKKKYQELNEKWNKTLGRYKDAFHAMLFAMIKETDRPLLGILLLGIDFLQMTAFCFIDFDWGPWGAMYGIVLEGFQIERLVVKEGSFTVHIIMVAISLLLIVIMLGLAAYNLRAFTNKNFSAVWPLRLLRTLTGLLVGVLYLPTIGFLLSILTCHHPENPECWTPLHYAFLVPSFLATLLFVPFTLMMSVSYFYPDPRSPSMLARPSARLELLEIGVKTLLAALFIFLSSYPSLRAFLTLFCFIGIAGYLLMYLPYYQNKTNHMRTGLTLHTVWASLLSIIVSFAPEIGHVMFIVYMVTSVPVAVASYYAVRWRIMRATSRGQSSMYEAKGYEEMWTQQEQTDTRLWHPSQVEIATRFLIEDESPEALDVADAIFVKGVQMFPNSASLMVAAALFYARYKKNWSMAQLYLKKAALNNPKFDLQFTLYMIEIEEKAKASSSNKMGARVLDAVERVEYRHLLKTATQQHRDAKMHMANFWQALYSGSVNTSTLVELASKIEKSDKAAEDAYKTLNSRFPNPRVLTQYARFLDEIHHNLEESDNVMAQIIGSTKKESQGKMRADLTKQRRSKKELKDHREYSRQVHGIQSSANNRMVRITKGVIIVLFVIALVKALWTLAASAKVQQNVTVVEDAGFCRRRVLGLCATSRLLQSHALNNDTTSLEEVRQQGLTEADDLERTFRALIDFSKTKRTRAKAFETWVAKRNVLNVYHSETLKTNRTDVYATLEEATDLFVRHSKKIFSLNESSFDSFDGSMPPVQANASWRYVMDNGPVTLGELYRELGGVYDLEEEASIREYLFIQLALLGGTLIVLTIAGRGLFYPTIEKARRNRELVLQAFLQIPPEVTERLFDEYYVPYSVESKEDLSDIQNKVPEAAEGEEKEPDPEPESDDDDDDSDTAKSKTSAQGSSQTRYAILVKQSITALLIVAAAYTCAVLLDFYFVHYTMVNGQRGYLLGSVDYISERYEFATNELILKEYWLSPFPTSQVAAFSQRYENATAEERDKMAFEIGAPNFSGLLLLDVERMQEDLTQLLYFSFLTQSDQLFSTWQDAFHRLQFQDDTKSLAQRLVDYYEYLNMFAISGDSLLQSDITDDVQSAAKDVRFGLRLLRDLWSEQYHSDLTALTNLAYITLAICTIVLFGVYRWMLRPIMYHLMYAENERTAKLLLMIPVDVVPQLEGLHQLLHISGKARVKGLDENRPQRESALNIDRDDLDTLKRRLSSGPKTFKKMESPVDSSGFNTPRSPPCLQKN